MPSLQKVLHFLGGCLVTMLGVGLMGFGMSDPWAVSKLECASQGSNILDSTNFYNGTADISFGLFSMVVSRDSCPSFGTTNTYASRVFRLYSDLVRAAFLAEHDFIFE